MAHSMAWQEHVRFYLDCQTWGGLLPERLLAAVPLAEGLHAGLVLNLSTSGKPTLEYWERIDDIERQGFVPIGEAKARAICDALPRFLDRLEQARSDGRQKEERGETPT